jgi:hypothetical protein
VNRLSSSIEAAFSLPMIIKLCRKLVSVLAREFDVVQAVSDANRQFVVHHTCCRTSGHSTSHAESEWNRGTHSKTSEESWWLFLTARDDIDNCNTAFGAGRRHMYSRRRLCVDTVSAIKLAMSVTQFVSSGLR